MDKTLKDELLNIIKKVGQQPVTSDSVGALRNSWPTVVQPPSWQSPDDCKGCRCLICWPDYPLGGGTKTFCGYWVLMEGKGKKIVLSKVTRCPKEESLQNKMLLG